MNAGFFKRLGAFVLLCIVQILVLNNIHLFGCATPLLYAMFVLSFNRNYPRWAILLWCFTLGLVIDISSNTKNGTSSKIVVAEITNKYPVGVSVGSDPWQSELGTFSGISGISAKTGDAIINKVNAKIATNITFFNNFLFIKTPFKKELFFSYFNFNIKKKNKK